ncbi:MAG TPA: hypothetical protein VHX40_09085 [Acidimicrobiales bacterium]|jgi:hypothetical protein|nr:hypothetical protein [Acidimicrobiales bacterium]
MREVAACEAACRHVDCSFCGAPAGELCQNPDGAVRPTMWAHTTRLLTYRSQHHAVPRRCRRGRPSWKY